jgi:SAM-dependent methyltransferase
MIYDGLEDRNFFTAPGKWKIDRCAACGLARLNPRPSRETIGDAYASYYTHSAAPTTTQSVRASVRRSLAHGYLNGRYGCNFSPALGAGIYLLPFFPARRARAVRGIRHLLKASSTARLLDVGCGDGRFLLEMQRGGWIVEGIEPDPRASHIAREAGLDVREGWFGQEDFDPDRFDAVTFNHALEHLADPLAALHEAFRILKPGGFLSIATPNLRSAGHRRFGRHWLHLDPPRHLTIFDGATLRLALERCGFSVRTLSPTPLTRWTYRASAAVASGRDPFDKSFVPSRSQRLQARSATARAFLRRTEAEEVALLARKPEVS